MVAPMPPGRLIQHLNQADDSSNNPGSTSLAGHARSNHSSSNSNVSGSAATPASIAACSPYSFLISSNVSSANLNPYSRFPPLRGRNVRGLPRTPIRQAKGRGITAHLHNQRNLRFRLHLPLNAPHHSTIPNQNSDHHRPPPATQS